MMLEETSPREQAETLVRARTDDARNELGERFVQYAREHFPEAYASQQRDIALKNALIGGVVGFTLALTLQRLR